MSARERITDITALRTGDRIMVHHENHSTSHLTVLEPYGMYGTPAMPGVLCHVECENGWDTVLGEGAPKSKPVWRY